MAMREIKFRAWHDTKQSMMQEGDNYGTSSGIDCLVYKQQGQPVELMQYTGLLDKNGVEIYEGDIVKYHQAEYSEETELYEDRITSVEWADDCYALIHREPEIKLITPFNICRSKIIEVIGNIYENKELLEQ